MALSESQVQDLLYLYQLEIARCAELNAQQAQTVARLLASSSSTRDTLKQHSSDSILVSSEVADKLRKIGIEQYKLRGIVYDAFFHGV